jgi:hypothetical protein
MENGKTINELINWLIAKYNLDTANEKKLKHNMRMKIDRTIKRDKELLDEYNNSYEIKIAKTKAKVLSEEFCEKIENRIYDYLLSLNNLDVDEHTITKLVLEEHEVNTGLFNLIIDNQIKKPNVENLNTTGKLDEDFKLKLFIEHMFYAQFDFDEFQYTSDIITYLNFKNDKECVEFNDIIEKVTRLRNPHKYYFKKKK